MQKTPFSIVFLNIFIFSAKTGILVLDGVFTKHHLLIENTIENMTI
jgi:hypothetical protein